MSELKDILYGFGHRETDITYFETLNRLLIHLERLFQNVLSCSSYNNTTLFPWILFDLRVLSTLH
jgi:hypothetical protein